MKILLTGANGQLGSEIKRHPVLIEKHEIIALPHGELDIADLAAIQQAFTKYQPELVINAAAYTQVDKAQSEPQAAYAINAQGPGYLADVCAENDIPIIHISTDYIFNGQKLSAYVEDDKAAPINVYGETKWQGEELIRQANDKHIILRVSWVYGFYGNNFVKTMLRLGREREELRIVEDQIGCPTAAKEIADAINHIISVIDQPVWGTYHFCNGPATNWYEFAKTIIASAREYEDLKVMSIYPLQTQDYPTPAARPANSELACSKFNRQFNFQPRKWQDALAEVIKELYA